MLVRTKRLWLIGLTILLVAEVGIAQIWWPRTSSGEFLAREQRKLIEQNSARVLPKIPVFAFLGRLGGDCDNAISGAQCVSPEYLNYFDRVVFSDSADGKYYEIYRECPETRECKHLPELNVYISNIDERTFKIAMSLYYNELICTDIERNAIYIYTQYCFDARYYHDFVIDGTIILYSRQMFPLNFLMSNPDQPLGSKFITFGELWGM